jgi:hypothetical protein
MQQATWSDEIKKAINTPTAGLVGGPYDVYRKHMPSLMAYHSMYKGGFTPGVGNGV